MAYIGQTPTYGEFKKLDALTFDGSTTSYSMTTGGGANPVTPEKEETIIISLNGVLQEPGTAYTVSGSTITFASAPTTTDTFFGVLIGNVLSIGVPADNTITASKLSTALKTFTEDTFTGDGSTVAFTLSTAPGSDNAVLATIDGVVQPNSAYNISSTTLTFTAAPGASTSIRVLHLGFVTANAFIADASVGTAQLADNAVTSAKLSYPVAIDWEDKTANFTAVAGNAYFVNTSSNAVTATLPLNPTKGDQVRFLDVKGTFSTNNLTVTRNGDPIQGSATDLVVNSDRSGFSLVYFDSTEGWLLLEV